MTPISLSWRARNVVPVVGVILAYSAAMSWQSWTSHQKDVQGQLKTVAELASKSVDSYLAQLAADLEGLAEDLAAGDPQITNLDRGHDLFRRFHRLHPELVNLTMIRPDGTVPFTAKAGPGQDPHSLAQEESFVRFLRDAGSETTQIGQPMIAVTSKVAIIPVRRVLRDAGGKVLGFVSASLPPEHLQSFWHDAPITASAAIGMFKDDGYLVARYPVPASSQLQDLFGQPRRGEAFQYLQSKGFPMRDQFEGVASADGVASLFVFRRLDRVPLTLFIALPLSVIRASWWNSSQNTYLALAALLCFMGFGYAYSSRRERAWTAAGIREQDERRAAEQRYQMLFARMLNGFSLHEIICDGEGRPVDYRFLAVNPAFEAMTGLKASDIVGRTVLEVLPGTEPYWIDTFGKVALTGEPTFYENYSKELDKHFEVMTFQPARGQFACVIQDVTERKRSERKIEALALYDQLTELPNRFNLRQRLEQALSMERRKNSQLAVLLVDLDNFKGVNDVFGHSAGDQLLVEVSKRLAQCVRASDVVSRVGGDEFVVVITDIASPNDAALVAAKILESIAAPVRIAGHDWRGSASVGICMFPQDTSNLDELLSRADLAMYEAKRAGRARFQFFKEEFQLAAEKRQRTESELRTAIEKGQFVLHYQPQLNFSTGRICGFEALVRWQHPQRGLVMPAEFIGIAEESGLINPLSDWVLEEAIRQLAHWRSRGGDGLQMSVNLSAAQFGTAGLPSQLLKLLDNAGLPPSCLELEITETMAMQSPQSAIPTMAALSSHGHALCLDDFGTGYSSLAYLRQLPLDALKIDRSFVSGMERDGNLKEICEMSVLLAHKLGLEVVAEGVETTDQMEFLRGLGCERMQGYLLSKPLPPLEAEAFITESRTGTNEKAPRIEGPPA